jgi:orotate phosphoribosyltransferase
MAYVRSKPKEHGRKNQVEGRLMKGQRVVVVEDLISTGMSSVAVVDVLIGIGVHVEAVLAIFSYGFDRARQVFEEAGVPSYTLTTLDELLTVAATKGHLNAEAIASMRSWQRDPQAWSDAVEGE